MSDDIKLPELPKGVKNSWDKNIGRVMQDYARAAVLADREKRGEDAVRKALEETQSLLVAMLNGTRHPGEISAQIVANRAALSAQEGK